MGGAPRSVTLPVVLTVPAAPGLVLVMRAVHGGSGGGPLPSRWRDAFQGELEFAPCGGVCLYTWTGRSRRRMTEPRSASVKNDPWLVLKEIRTGAVIQL